MATVQELKDALKENLERTGKLRKIRAELRAGVLGCLNTSNTQAVAPPQPSNQNLLINELIREYLIFNGHRESLSVFVPETGQPHTRPFDRAFISAHLHIPDGPNTQQLPLIYSLVEQAAAIKPPPGQLPSHSNSG